MPFSPGFLAVTVLAGGPFTVFFARGAGLLCFQSFVLPLYAAYVALALRGFEFWADLIGVCPFRVFCFWPF